MKEVGKTKFEYLAQSPKKYTFQQPKLRKWVESWCNGNTLNLFAGKTLLSIKEVRVDVDSSAHADYHMDAFEFIHLAILKGWKYSTIILDPPYNIRKAREKYNGRHIGKLKKLKNQLVNLVDENGIVITLGYDTVGMSKSRGFEKIAVCVVCHNGDFNDTLAVVERKLGSLDRFIDFQEKELISDNSDNSEIRAGPEMGRHGRE